MSVAESVANDIVQGVASDVAAADVIDGGEKPFDNVTPSIAYSVSRKLRYGYAGNAIQVRRSSDSTTQDIGFGADGLLDQSALTTFVGAGDGFVRVLYDQSGNGTNLTQTTDASQPQIVSSGTVLTANSQPTMLFDGTADFFAIAPSYFAGSFSVLIVVKPEVSGTVRVLGVTPTTAGQDLYYARFEDPSGTLRSFLRIDAATATAAYTAATSTNLSLLIHLANSVTLSHGLNNSALETMSTATLTLANFDQSRNLYLGGLNDASPSYGNCRISEFVLFSSDQAANIEAFRTDINNHYALW